MHASIKNNFMESVNLEYKLWHQWNIVDYSKPIIIIPLAFSNKCLLYTTFGTYYTQNSFICCWQYK